MKANMTMYTMTDVNRIQANIIRPESYRITLSRGGVNGGIDTASVEMDANAFESFVDRAKALLPQSVKYR